MKIKIVFLFSKYGNYKRVQRVFKQEKQGFVPSKGTIYRIVKKFRENGSIIDGPRHRPKVMDERKVEEIKKILAENPKISIKELSSKVNMGFTSLFRLRQDYPNELGQLTNRMRTLKNDEKSKSMIRFGRGIKLSDEHIQEIKRILVEHPTYTAAQVADLVGVSRKNKVLVEMRNKYLSEHGIRIPKIKKNKFKSKKNSVGESSENRLQTDVDEIYSSSFNCNDFFDSEWCSLFDLPQKNTNLSNTFQSDIVPFDYQHNSIDYPPQELTDLQCFYMSDCVPSSTSQTYSEMSNVVIDNRIAEESQKHMPDFSNSVIEFNYSDLNLNHDNLDLTNNYF